MFPESTDYDEAARFLLRQGGGPFVTWLMAEPAEGHRFIGWLDSVLTLPGTKERLCDAVARLEKPDGWPMALLAESQTYPDPSMFGRLCVAGGILWETVRPSDLPDDRYGLMALVLNLTGTGNSGRTFRGASSVWEVSPCEWNLADEDAEAMLEAVEAATAPLEAIAFIPLIKRLTVTDYGATELSGGIRPGRRTPGGSAASRHGSGAGSASPPDFASPHWPAPSPGATA
jgi:hypothetical protein